MIKISKDPRKVPEWLKCKKTMIPDFVAENPKVRMIKPYNIFKLIVQGLINKYRDWYKNIYIR